MILCIQFNRKNCMPKTSPYPRRVVLDGVVLESGDPKDIGGSTPIKSGEKWGRAPARWTVPVLVLAQEEKGLSPIAEAEIVYETVFPDEIRAKNISILSLRGQLSGEVFTAQYIDELGEFWGNELVVVTPLLDRIPGGTIATAERQLKEMELLKVATAYAAGGTKGFKAVSDVMGIPRQTAALRIQAAREAGFLPPVDTPTDEVWDHVMQTVLDWQRTNGVDQ